MRPSIRSNVAIAFALVTIVCSLRAAAAEDLINRRDQARGAFLAAPQGIYEHYCGHCHGEDAAGGGRLWATELSASPADLTALRQPKEYILAWIRHGSAAQGKSSLCPPWGRTLSPANVERLALYIASLGSETSQRPAEPATAAESVREPFPWLLAAVLLLEIVLLGAMLRRR